jgi:hypothetical protein
VFGGLVAASPASADVALTNDNAPGDYVSAYTLATGTPYTDPTLGECSISRGRQNEPAVAVDPRDSRVVLGSSNDYCGVYNATDAAGNPVPAGPIWLGYYRSQNGGDSFVSSLVPGYPGDSSPFAALAKIRTASSGDPVIAWDSKGRAFFGSESSDDPAGSAKTFGDVWVATYDNPGGPSAATVNDGKRYRGTTLVARGSSAPNLLGKFNDKTAIEADHNTDGRCDDDVYFSWSRFTGNAGGSAIYFTRSTDHGSTFSSPARLSQTINDVQFADIAVTGSSNVYVTFRSGASGRGPEGDAVYYVRSTADQFDTAHPERFYVVYDPSKPGTEVPTGTTYGSIETGTGSQSGVYFVRVDGSSGSATDPALIDNQATGHQLFPDISADNPDASTRGTLHAIWWDSRLDPCYSPARPIGNCPDRTTVPSLDAFGSRSTDYGSSWSAGTQLSDVSSNPNYEQFADRTVPFAGDYLYVSSVGDDAFGVWTDWRFTVAGTDPREVTEDEDDTTADVTQCRVFESGAWSGDRCPHAGGLDQDILGDVVP